MTKRTRLFLAILVIIALVLVGVFAWLFKTGKIKIGAVGDTAILTGTTVDVDTNKALANKKIVLRKYDTFKNTAAATYSNADLCSRPTSKNIKDQYEIASGKDGKFSIKDLPATKYYINFCSPNDTTYQELKDQGSTIDLAAGTTEIKVQYPIAQIQTTADKNGNYSFAKVPAGKYTATSTGNVTTKTGDIEIKDGQKTTFDFVTVPVANLTINGHVTVRIPYGSWGEFSSDDNVSGIAVSICNGTIATTCDSSTTTKTDANGNFKITKKIPLTQKTIAFGLSKDGYQSRVSGTFDLTGADDIAYVVITTQSDGTVDKEVDSGVYITQGLSVSPTTTPPATKIPNSLEGKSVAGAKITLVPKNSISPRYIAESGPKGSLDITIKQGDKKIGNIDVEIIGIAKKTTDKNGFVKFDNLEQGIYNLNIPYISDESGTIFIYSNQTKHQVIDLSGIGSQSQGATKQSNQSSNNKSQISFLSSFAVKAADESPIDVNIHGINFEFPDQKAKTLYNDKDNNFAWEDITTQINDLKELIPNIPLPPKIIISGITITNKLYAEVSPVGKEMKIYIDNFLNNDKSKVDPIMIKEQLNQTVIHEMGHELDLGQRITDNSKNWSHVSSIAKSIYNADPTSIPIPSKYGVYASGGLMNALTGNGVKEFFAEAFSSYFVNNGKTKEQNFNVEGQSLLEEIKTAKKNNDSNALNSIRDKTFLFSNFSPNNIGKFIFELLNQASEKGVGIYSNPFPCGDIFSSPYQDSDNNGIWDINPAEIQQGLFLECGNTIIIGTVENDQMSFNGDVYKFNNASIKINDVDRGIKTDFQGNYEYKLDQNTQSGTVKLKAEIPVTDPMSPCSPKDPSNAISSLVPKKGQKYKINFTFSCKGIVMTIFGSVEDENESHVNNGIQGVNIDIRDDKNNLIKQFQTDKRGAWGQDINTFKLGEININSTIKSITGEIPTALQKENKKCLFRHFSPSPTKDLTDVNIARYFIDMDVFRIKYNSGSYSPPSFDVYYRCSSPVPVPAPATISGKVADNKGNLLSGAKITLAVGQEAWQDGSPSYDHLDTDGHNYQQSGGRLAVGQTVNVKVDITSAGNKKCTFATNTAQKATTLKVGDNVLDFIFNCPASTPTLTTTTRPSPTTPQPTAAPTTQATTTGTLTVFVRNNSGNPISGVAVKIPKLSFINFTDTTGKTTFPNTPPGVYVPGDITATYGKTGYNTIGCFINSTCNITIP